MDIEISAIDNDKRSKVFKDVVEDLGPPDATISIEVREIALSSPFLILQFFIVVKILMHP
jgi:Domain of unknown function (DUF1866)